MVAGAVKAVAYAAAPATPGRRARRKWPASYPTERHGGSFSENRAKPSIFQPMAGATSKAASNIVGHDAALAGDGGENRRATSPSII